MTSTGKLHSRHRLPVFEERPSIAIKVRQILLETAVHHQVKIDAMKSRGRGRHISYARMEAMWRLRTELKFSFPRIGRVFDFDHTSAIHAVRRVDEIVARDGAWPVASKKYIYGPFSPYSKAQMSPAEIKAPRRKELSDSQIVARARRQATIINSFWAARGVEAGARPVRETGGRIVVRSDLQMVSSY